MNRPTRVSELDGVAEQVEHNLLQPVWIDTDDDTTVEWLIFVLQLTRAYLWHGHRLGIAKYFVEIDVVEMQLGMTGAQSCVIQHFSDEA